MFSKYHYLDHSLNWAARVFVGYVNGDMAGLVAVLPQPGLTKKLYRITRLVVLPDFQGLGVGNIMNEWIGELYWREDKKRLSIVTTHPGLIGSYVKSKRWMMQSFDKGVKVDGNFDKNELSTRLKASFIYIPVDYKKDKWDL